MATPPRPESPHQTFGGELRDAISPRTVALVAGVLVLQLAFITSYIGAFHHPVPHGIPVEVVAPSPIAGSVASKLNAISGTPLHASAAPSGQRARTALRRDVTAGVFVPSLHDNRDTLLVADAGGSAQATAIETIFAAIESVEHRTVTVRDLVPLQPGDSRGLSSFYLVIGWLVGGYLLASLLGVSAGSRPATPRRATIRLLSAIPYAVLSGLGGAVIIGPVLGAVNGHFLAIWGTGTLLVLSAATVTMAFQVLFGVIGIGITVLVFVVLGNPSAGGAYQASVLPAFWRIIGGALPNGAGTTLLRQIVYFGSYGTLTPLLIVVGWIVGGVAVTLVGSERFAHAATVQPAVP